MTKMEICLEINVHTLFTALMLAFEE